MKKLILTAGDIVVEEETFGNRFIGGKIIATNTKTGETFEKSWKNGHGGRNNRLTVICDVVAALAPKEEN